MSLGRFAPSPTGRLHLGNLRTALLSWLVARSAGGAWLVRMEDLDLVTSSAAHEAAQLAELAALGLVSDLPVVRQSERFDAYRQAIAELAGRGLTYPCYCSRREIREASSAPHGAAGEPGGYPGTCRTLSAARLRELAESGRPPAIRLRAAGQQLAVLDRVHGEYRATVDDVVLQRNDGVPAYNLAVVVDDAAQGVTEVVRGDDLLSSTPRQVALQQLLGLATPSYVHVPLVLGADGTRLAKRHGAVTLEDLAERGVDPHHVLHQLARSIGITDTAPGTPLGELLDHFSLHRVPREPWVIAEDLPRS